MMRTEENLSMNTANLPRVSLRHASAEQQPNRKTLHQYDCVLDGGTPDPMRDYWAVVNALLERFYHGHA
jgi:hypothetical protein